jgi:hypothetical protein
MSVEYVKVKSELIKTDLDVRVEGMTMLLQMTSFSSNEHSISRGPDMETEMVELVSDPLHDTRVFVYLVDDPIFEEVEEDATSYIMKTNSKGEKVLQEVQEKVKVVRLVENTGTFIVHTQRIGIDQDYNPENVIAILTSFMIPAGFSGSLEDIKIPVLKVVR